MPARLGSGTFLIASPRLDNIGELELGDSNFNRTVVLLLEYHVDQGAWGVVINRPLGDKIKLYTSEALKRLTDGLEAMQIAPVESGGLFFQGGPVQPGSMIFLHQLDYLIDDSTEICPGVFAGGNLDAIRAHTAVMNAESPVLRFYLGCASWSAGQLEQEITQRDSWILRPGSADLVFSAQSETVWHESVYSLGGKYRPISFIPEYLLVN